MNLTRFITDKRALRVRTAEGKLIEAEEARSYLEDLLEISPKEQTEYYGLKFYILSYDAHRLALKVKETQHTLSLYFEYETQTTRFHATLSYNGTLFEGFQRQKHKETVQGTLEAVLNHLTNQDITIHPSGRTDKGVHAEGQSFHFDAETTLTDEKLKELINKMTPQSIHIRTLKRVPNTFHARYDAYSKTYRYRLIHKDDCMFAHLALRTPRYDISALEEVFRPFIGTHDFKHFAKNTEGKETVRSVEAIWVQQENDFTDIYVKGKGFLHNMVRNMVGTALYDLDFKKQEVKCLLSSKETLSKRYLAPANGLTLYCVDYHE